MNSTIYYFKEAILASYKHSSRKHRSMHFRSCLAQIVWKMELQKNVDFSPPPPLRGAKKWGRGRKKRCLPPPWESVLGSLLAGLLNYPQTVTMAQKPHIEYADSSPRLSKHSQDSRGGFVLRVATKFWNGEHLKTLRATKSDCGRSFAVRFFLQTRRSLTTFTIISGSKRHFFNKCLSVSCR